MALILLSILLLFMIGEYLSNGLHSFAFSSVGILESLLFALVYIYFRKNY
ncbi:putative membrane protein [Synechococcus sp. BOUM118]|nr:putative membrane protein [Synechococcus sp. BOUM118]